MACRAAWEHLGNIAPTVLLVPRPLLLVHPDHDCRLHLVIELQDLPRTVPCKRRGSVGRGIFCSEASAKYSYAFVASEVLCSEHVRHQFGPCSCRPLVKHR